MFRRESPALVFVTRRSSHRNERSRKIEDFFVVKCSDSSGDNNKRNKSRSSSVNQKLAVTNFFLQICGNNDNNKKERSFNVSGVDHIQVDTVRAACQLAL
jgi:hypothetical protein